MSEPVSYVVSLAIPDWGLRSWLAFPCPAPDRWTDWNDLDIVLEPDAFELATRLSGRKVGAILDEWASAGPAGWHFAWADGQLSLVALEGAESWREHLLFLCAVRAASDHGAGPGAAIADGYVWQTGAPAWALSFTSDGTSRVSPDLATALRSPLDMLAKPVVEAARAGASGLVRNDLSHWRGE